MSSTLKDSTLKNNELTFEQFKAEVLNDYKLAAESREASLRGRKEVLTGKAKFGIFGDGKEIAQIAMAKAFQEGDFRSGYYRDQTFMFAIKMANIQQFFAQLYANPDLEHDPFSAGRQMNAHFSTRSLDENGLWKNLTEIKNSSADSSPTASQMTRALGLSFASKLYRASDELKDTGFSNNGNEVCFCTIGDASTSEGLFWETVNAAGVLKAPLAISIWDDGYGISVPKKYQTTKGDISTLLEGFRVNEKGEGFEIYKVNGWDYAALCETYAEGIKKVRETHIPAIFHITEVTQPQGHSTSGSHERYKSKKRLEWEQEFDCIKKFKEWILANNIAEEDELSKIDAEAAEMVNTSKKEAWKAYISPVKNQIKEAVQRISQLGEKTAISQINELADSLKNMLDPIRKDAVIHLKKALWFSRETESPERQSVSELLEELLKENKSLYNSHLISESEESPLKIEIEEAAYEEDAKTLNGFEILNACFDENINRDPRIFAFGEDVGKIGDVNQAFAGLQEKHGELRIFDTGIREATIIGQGLGMAMRGLRPIAEIQYLDYLIYGLQPLTDDVATLQYRTKGGQKAPLIVRTRGHRLEGIWHTGSPIGMIINSLRGMHVLVPRNMTQAAGFYNTLLRSDDPALVIECLNGYRLKEKLPSNIGTFTLPLGQPEVLKEGNDITLVTYGSCVRVAQDAIKLLENFNIDVELIDVQSLLPFDLNHEIVESVKKTNRLIVLDEDVPGGASAYILQKVLEEQKAYNYLDSQPRTITAVDHRSPYGSDGDYFSKPNVEDIFEIAYEMMYEFNPSAFPKLY